MTTNGIEITLTSEEYQSAYNAIRYCAEADFYLTSESDCRNLNIILLKMMKSKDPDYFVGIGPWETK
jgi:hypothetical protein